MPETAAPTRLVATIWYCGDELDGECYQAQIDRTRPHPVTKGFVLREEVWRGTYINEPQPGEMDMIKGELRAAAAERGIPLEEKDGYLPFGAIDEEPHA